jgi:glycosyltransferase involved in cell wall biosynthesis
VIYREAALLGPALYERLLRLMGKPIFFDFDDSIWIPPPVDTANGLFSRLHFFGKTSSICRVSRAVTPGNEFLARYCRQYNQNVHVVPTSIELDDYPVVPEPAQEDPFVICWTGSTTTLAHFEHARPALERLARTRRIAVKVICNLPPERPIEGAENRFVPWSAANEAQEIGDCHVGIMPLQDTMFSHGKCGLKALQYMATGRPAVVSPVGMNVDLVQDGENGFLASTDDELVDALTRLAEDRDLRHRLGRAARKTVEERFSAEAVARQYAGIVRDALARPQADRAQAA